MKQFFVFSLLIILLSAFTGVKPNDKTVDTKSLTVIVTKYGKPQSGIKVNFSVCGGLSCVGGGDNVYTDNEGRATIKWTTNCSVCTIYVDGKSYEGSYSAGGKYTFSL